MKPLTVFIIGCIMPAVIISSCRFHHHNINISYTETGHTYSMHAHFDRNKTRKVQHYLNRSLGSYSNMSFVNARIDGEIAMDNKTRFYIRLRPGELKIKLDKRKNTYGSYREIKEMCEGIKDIVK